MLKCVNATRELKPWGIQVCFCGPGSSALPAEPLDVHDHFCLIWDWAMAHGKITPQQRLGQLGESSRDLGISEEELAREEASLRAFWPFREAAGKLIAGALYRKPAPLGSCYRAAAGFMVHVKPGCRC
jgi:hypothetical protein